MAARLIGNDLRFSCPHADPALAELQKNLVLHVLRINNRDGGVNIWQRLRREVLTYGVAYVLACYNKEARFPIRLKNLNVFDTGVLYTDLGCTFAWTSYKEYEHEKEKADKDRLSEFCPVTEYYYLEDDKVWMVEEEDGELGEPEETKYAQIPIIRFICEDGEVDNQAASVSILSGLEETWARQCLSDSVAVTGMEQYYWPAVYAQTEGGGTIPDIVIRPGQLITNLPPKTKFDVIPGRPEVGLLQLISEMNNRELSQRSFPPALFTGAGAASSGYVFNTDASLGAVRIASIIQNLEDGLSNLGSLILCIAKRYNSGKLSLSYYQPATSSYANAEFKGSEIDPSYTCEATIKPSTPTNPTGDMAMGLQLNSAGVISKRTLRQEVLPYVVAQDEDDQITMEKILADPQRIQQAIQQMVQQVAQGSAQPGADQSAQMGQTPSPGLPSGMVPGMPVGANPGGPVLPGADLPFNNVAPTNPVAAGQLQPESFGMNGNAPPQDLLAARGEQMTPEMMSAIMSGRFNQ